MCLSKVHLLLYPDPPGKADLPTQAKNHNSLSSDPLNSQKYQNLLYEIDVCIRNM